MQQRAQRMEAKIHTKKQDVPNGHPVRYFIEAGGWFPTLGPDLPETSC